MDLTKWIIVSAVGLIGLVDIALAVIKGKEATISVTITKWSKEYPAIPFAFGFLMGHFFAQNC